MAFDLDEPVHEIDNEAPLLARGLGALNLATMRDIVASWLITIPMGALLSIVFYYLVKTVVLDSGIFAA